jgi:glycosyltransferase involved in cell wall biosynthesis
MISVIVPAHNEEKVLPRCLASICNGADPAELEVVVVCNGCSDASARVAREFAFPVRVIETKVASKAHAWNLGDEVASSFPRFYVDADVRISWSAVRAVAEALVDPQVLAAAPRIEVDTKESSRAVKAFFRIWLQLPYFTNNMIGSGVFALSEAGRSRFGCFPEVIADDEFVRRRFRSNERRTVPGCTFTIFAPHDAASLARIKTRSRLGRIQLDRQGFGPAGGTEGSQVEGMRILARSLANWPPLVVYVAITLWARLRAHRQASTGAFRGWERDDSSRAGVEANR